MKKSFKLITLFNIPVDVNYTWFIILGLVIFSLASSYFPFTNPELSTFAHWSMAIIAALLLFTSLLAHEFSHALVARKNNLPIRGITLFVFGGVAHMEKEPQSPSVEFKMAIAGPIMSFFLSLVFFCLTQILQNIGTSRAILAITNYLYVINLIVGIFNLIPGFPLDGGRVLRATLWKYFNDIRKATSIATAFGKGFAFFLMAIGFLNLISGSIISGIWFIFIGLFLQEAADVSYRQVVMKKFLSGAKVKNVMTQDVITVPGDMTLKELIDEYFLKLRHTTFPVVEEDTILGIITLHDVKEVPRNQWPEKLSRDVMTPIDNRLVTTQETHALDALAKMSTNRIGRLLIIEDSKLVGILSQRDVMRLFEFKAEIEG